MKMELDIKFEGCTFASDLNGSFSGVVDIDEFGIIKSVSVNSSSFGTCKEDKIKVKQLLAETAEGIRAKLIRK